MNKPIEKHDYTVSQVAKVFSCAPGTVKNWIKTGKVKAYRLGGPQGRDYRVPWAEVDRLRSEWICAPETEQTL